mgnify:CR=1 FL=1
MAYSNASSGHFCWAREAHWNRATCSECSDIQLGYSKSNNPASAAAGSFSGSPNHLYSWRMQSGGAVGDTFVGHVIGLDGMTDIDDVVVALATRIAT